ncbi:hypothetical protein B0O80DRAFT_490193 [Mortierella sp. GBAus27b]|nr:hypothetical protein B0O80DRAFT_490193 [Mortierella sp. GBAus27b]
MSPFDIPELLSLVACYLDRSSLYASIQVCRAWHGICFPLLWSSCLFTAEIYGAYHDVYDEHAPLIRHMQAKGRLIGGEMRYVAHRCPNLASLSLQHCQVTPMSLDTLFDGLPNVQSLTFDLCSGVNSSSIATRLARLPRLSKLEIVVHAQQRGNGDWREDDVALMLTNCVSLESLKIVGPDLSHVHLLSIQRQEKPLQLKHLHLVSTFISEKALKTLLLKSPNLSTLILLHNANKSSTVHLIGENGPMLEMLQLRNSKSVTMSAFDTLFKKCPLLKTLDISFTLIQDATLAGLAHHCPQLRVLDLTGCSRITHDAFQALEITQKTSTIAHG